MTLSVLQVGLGPTGVAVADALTRRWAAEGTDVRYTVCEPAGLGAGTAFSTPVATHLVNVRPGGMSLDPGAPDDFAVWCREHEHRWAGRLPIADRPAGRGEFPPRVVFGAYAEDRARRVLDTAARDGVGVRLRRCAVSGLVPLPDGRWRARFARVGDEHPDQDPGGDSGGDFDDFDEVVLCVGHLPPDPHGLPPATVADGDLPGMEIDPGARIGVVGSRLTAIDAVLGLRARGHTGPVVMASRSGLLPSVKGAVGPAGTDTVAELVAATGPGTLTLGRLARAVAADIERAEDRPIDWGRELTRPATTADDLRREIDAAATGTARPWQGVLTALIPLVPSMWHALDPDGREQFLTRHLTAWATRIAAFPEVSARRILAELDAGSVTLHSGLRAVRPGRRGTQLDLDDGTRTVDLVVNATGPGFGRHALAARPLTRALIEHGVLVPHRHGGVRVDPSTFRALAPDGRPRPGLRIVGDLTRGTFLATNAVGNNVTAAHRLAAQVSREPRMTAAAP